ncbi:MAG: HNH endonuclease, partial [bacterium]
MDTNDVLARVARLSDHDLLAQVKDLARREREATVALIVHLAELDERRLYLAEGYPSLFKYCTDVLHLSEHAAYNRIETARAVRHCPVLLEHLAAGWVTLFAVRRLAPHLTPANHRGVLALARHKSKREIEELIARLRPQPPVPDVIRKLPARTLAASTVPLSVGGQDAPSTSQDDDTSEIVLTVAQEMPAPATPPAPPARRAVVSPLAPERYKVQFTAGAEVHAKLREAQALLRYQIPDGDLEQIFDRALEALLANLRKHKLAATDRPRENRTQASGAEPNSVPRSRHIPAAVRRTVWARDSGRCAFVSTDGQRCAEAAFLEFHHVVPYARGGPSSVSNIELRCRAHNGYEAECHFGRWGTAGVREEPEAYVPRASAVGVAVSGASTNSFWNEFRKRLRRQPRMRQS